MLPQPPDSPKCIATLRLASVAQKRDPDETNILEEEWNLEALKMVKEEPDFTKYNGRENAQVLAPLLRAQ